MLFHFIRIGQHHTCQSESSDSANLRIRYDSLALYWTAFFRILEARDHQL
jgi:hypothetical protein